MDADVAHDALGNLQGGVGDLFGRDTEVYQPAQRHGVVGLLGGPEGPRFEPRLERVDLDLQVRHLFGERLVVEEDRAVRQIDRQLREILHQHDGIDRAL